MFTHTQIKRKFKTKPFKNMQHAGELYLLPNYTFAD